MEAREDDGRRTWVWIAIAIGGLALSALCLVPPVLWLASEEVASEDAPLPPVTPAPPSAPLGPPPSPSPPLGPPPSPSPPLGPPPWAGSTSPRHVEAVIETVTGLDVVRAGSTCSFDVTRHDQPDGTFVCNAQVICAGQLLYGGPNAGYFPCTLHEQPERHVVGEDAQMTRGDRDAAMRLDTLRRVLTVRDDSDGPRGAFNLRARVTRIQ